MGGAFAVGDGLTLDSLSAPWRHHHALKPFFAAPVTLFAFYKACRHKLLRLVCFREERRLLRGEARKAVAALLVCLVDALKCLKPASILQCQVR